jgi:hypothetical protein
MNRKIPGLCSPRVPDRKVFEPRQSNRAIASASTLCLWLLITGCARLDYVKVPGPTQYDNWSDAQQAKADQMKGVRYYLPRPFLNLKASVPVAQRVAFITFQYDVMTGNYKLILPDSAPTWVRRVAPTQLSIAQAFAATAVTLPKASTGGALQGSTVGVETNATTTPTNAAPQETPAQTITASTGFINDTDPVTKLGPLFDVVYLPDMEEQYVIQPHTGFAGQADVETKLRNGWAAETFSQKVSNAQLIPYVIRQFQQASDTAAKIATTWLPTATLGLPPNTSLADMMKFISKGPGGLQAGKVEGTNEAPALTAQDVLGRALIFKIAEVRVAQPGLYPILKPREMKQWLKPAVSVIGGGDPELDFETYIQQAKVPWIRPDMAFIPCPPFTMIGFNTTIDVFLAPATERIGLAPSAPTNAGQPPGQSIAANDLSKPVHDALLKAAKNSNVPELKGLTAQGIVVESQKDGTTKITLTTTPANTFQAAKDSDYVTWAQTALNLDQSKTKIMTSFGADATKLEISIESALSEVVKSLPK